MKTATMDAKKNIMVATDFSERSDRALRRAIILAKQTDAAISLIHVVDNDQLPWLVEKQFEAATLLLRELATTLRDIDGVPCEPRVILAAPHVGIIQAVADAAPDLLIVGPHRRHDLLDVFVGTTAERTIRAVSCPVLMVNAPPVGPYHHVLLSTDLSANSAYAMQRFAALAITARVCSKSILYVFDALLLRVPSVSSMSAAEEARHLQNESKVAERELGQFVRSLENQSFAHAALLLRNETTVTANDILAAATDIAADLIVVGTQGRSGLAKLMVGSVAEKVLRYAVCDVLAVPPQR